MARSPPSGSIGTRKERGVEMLDSQRNKSKMFDRLLDFLTPSALKEIHTDCMEYLEDYIDDGLVQGLRDHIEVQARVLDGTILRERRRS